jgi:hypothetical protein
MQSSTRSLNFLIILSTFFFSPLSAQYGKDINIGIGVGIQSYPTELNGPCYPVPYPSIEISTLIIEKIYITSSMSRNVYETNLPYFYSIQHLKLITSALGIDYNIGSNKKKFNIGAQLLTGFSKYSHGDHYSSGLGFKIYLIAKRHVSSTFAWGIRTGIQRLSIQPVRDIEGIDLDSVNIEFIGYLTL